MPTESFFSSASLAYLASAGAGKDGKTYSIKPTDGTGDFTFSRGSNLAATRVGADGLIEKGRENLLTYSNDFSQWTKSGTTTTSGQSGYDGSSDAWLITKSGGAFDQILRNASSSGVNTISFYAKAGTLSSVYFRGQASSSIPDVKFNLSDGSLTTSNNVISASSDDIGSGWYRLKMTFSNTITNVTIYPDFGQTNAGSIYIQDAQLEIGLAATDYIESGATTGKAGLLEDEPRFDYSGGATCPSLLLEPSRTNLVKQTEYFNATDHIINPNISVTNNVTTSPEGLTNAAEITFDSNTTRGLASLAFGDYSNQTHSVSIYAKSSGGVQNVRLKLTAGGVADYFSSNFLLTDEWQRFEFSQAFGATTTSNIQGGIVNGTGETTGTAYIYGLQLEANASYPTSYIPNHSGGSVTRGAEASSVTGASSLIGQTEGTILCEFKIDELGNNIDILAINNSTNSEYIAIFKYTSNVVRSRIRANSISNTIDHLITATGTYKVALKYNASTFSLFINGVKINEIAATISFASTIERIFVGPALYVGLGKAKYGQLLTLTEALSDADCIALTT